MHVFEPGQLQDAPLRSDNSLKAQPKQDVCIKNKVR